MSARILELVDIFSDLTFDQLKQIYNLCTEETYIYNQVIFEERSPSKEIYIVLEGEVEIMVNTDPSQDQFKDIQRRIALIQKGQSFGEIALVDEGLRSATARCASGTCRLLVINRTDFINLIKEDKAIGFQVMYNLAADLCLKIRATNFLVRETLLYRGTSGEEPA